MKKIPYRRIGTTYWKDIEKPLISGDSISIMVRWNKETIIADHGKDYLSKISKLDGFCCIPEHIGYEQVVGNSYNTYHELPIKPKKGKCPVSMGFVRHIFGEQAELGLDYLKIIYENPSQILPILCLVSKERGTGKSTFIKWLKAIFGQNMTYIKGDSFSSQFNSDWVSKVIVAVDEVFFDKKEITERLKYLSTTDKDKMEAKGKDREEVEFFGKFILCSNNEDTFILIDSNEIRFWVRKVPTFDNEDTEYLHKLISEIPAFMQFLMERPYASQKKTRMWFTAEQIKTKALKKLVWLNNNVIEKEMVHLLYEMFEATGANELRITPREIVSNLSKVRRKNFEPNDIRRILKNKWELIPSDNSNSYQGYEFTSYGEFVQINRVGRYFTVERKKIYGIFDEMMN
ncbi:primase-helicase family protein [Galbibacter orientalis]|uniref:primase-helicase family protein n=1 Tax=Galbibacter orientalis TaxID=453852 RepID=UPI00308092CA